MSLFVGVVIIVVVDSGSNNFIRTWTLIASIKILIFHSCCSFFCILFYYCCSPTNTLMFRLIDQFCSCL